MIVGGGIAGLTAAWNLRDLDVVVLEADERVGGRMWSRPSGDYWMSVGAHMFPPADSIVGRLVTEMGLRTLPIGGSMLNMAYRGKLVHGVRPELFPFLLPLSIGGRISFARAGLRVKRNSNQYARLMRRAPGETAGEVLRRLLRFHGDETFADFLGPLHPEALAIFQALANRSTAEPDEISQSAQAALFAHVWDGGSLGSNLDGGASLLPDALAGALGDRIERGVRVDRVSRTADGVEVSATASDGARTFSARRVIMALPAHDALPLLTDVPGPLESALKAIRFGPFVVASIRTTEAGPMPWDDVYSVLAVDGSFNMLFNHSNCTRRPGDPRGEGGVLMVYGGADRARALWDLDDAEIERRFVDDLARLYPEVRDVVGEVWIQRWSAASPFAAPGRWRHQDALDAGIDGVVLFAGDWMGEMVSMECAAESAVAAAQRVRASVASAG